MERKADSKWKMKQVITELLIDDDKCGICDGTVTKDLVVIELDTGERFIAHENCWRNCRELFGID